jgi:seryl-tRNA synthetase
MLDIKRIREDFETVKKSLETRGQGDYGLENVRTLDEKRRRILALVEQKKNKQNLDSKEIPRLKKEGKDTTELMKEMKALSEEIKKLDGEVSEVEEELRNTLLNIPNTPSPDVAVGKSDADNVEIRKWGTPRNFDFIYKAHWDVGQDLDILDFERAAKISGARFTVYKGLGARLERAVINFMLDLHTKEHGYTESFLLSWSTGTP